MHRLTWAVAAVLFASCGGGNSGTRYFRVLFPATNVLPDSCYRADSVPPATMPDQLSAEQSCPTVTRKNTATTSMNNLVTSQAWTMLDTGQGGLYLLITSGATSSGVSGTLTGNDYSFTENASTTRKQCTGVGVTECGGACVNTRSDKTNCGQCGFSCSGSTPECRFGICTASCTPIMFTCNLTMVDTQSDDNNCGTCGHMCTGGQTCSGGNCVDPCQAVCSNKYNGSACAAPRQFSTATTAKIAFTINNGTLSGTVASDTSYSCMDPGCASDYAARCPACSQSSMVSGREVTNVTEFQQR